MRVGNFSVLIPEGIERDSGHVQLPHGTQYCIRIGNHEWLRCDAEVEVDGKPVGNFRLNQNETVTLERPADDRGRFTFFRVDSEEAQAVGQAEISRDDRGLIRVTFRPERRRQKNPAMDRSIYARGGSCCVPPVYGDFGTTETGCGGPKGLEEIKTSAGITGLTGKSEQTFHSVAGLDHDPERTVVVTLRLIAGPGAATPRKLEPAPRGNPVPLPVD